MKHANVAIFVPHNGCPHQCSFCNQRNITGQDYQPSQDDVKQTVEASLKNLGDSSKNSEIAFFGGSFTAIDRDYMISLLESTKPYIDFFHGIRISTRPDYIDDEILVLLKKYNVTTIELGAQSMDDKVLLANNRGHSAEDVVAASSLIKRHGFSLGLQMMTGLYKATPESDFSTAEQFVELKPDCVRIYPTVVLKNTELCALYENGDFFPYKLEQSVELCSRVMTLFSDNNIDVIRVGLHYSDSLAENDVAKNYHPAFRELCESRIFFGKILEACEGFTQKELVLTVNPSSVSKLIGQNRSNIKFLKKKGYSVKIERNNKLGKYDILVQ